MELTTSNVFSYEVSFSMLYEDVNAPISILVSHELSPAAKVLLICLIADKEDAELFEESKLLAPATLSIRTGLSTSTIHTALKDLEEKGWYISPYSNSNGTIAIRPLPHPQVTIPGVLLSEKEVNALGKVVYGIVQAPPDFKHPNGVFSYYTLSEKLQVSIRKVQTAVTQLTQTGWLILDNDSRKDKVQFTLCKPRVLPDLNSFDVVKRCLNAQGVNGTTLMHHYISIIVDSDDGLLNAELNFLRNPFNDELMNYGIYFTKYAVAIDCAEPSECYGLSPDYMPIISIEEAERAMKASISKKKGVTYIELALNELCYEKIVEKVQGYLPLRDVTKYQSSLDYLDKKRRAYERTF